LQELLGIDIEDEYCEDEGSVVRGFVHERGRSGEETTTMIRRLQDVMEGKSYDIVCILGGTNDLCRCKYCEDNEDMEIFSRLETMYKHVLARNCKLLAITIPEADIDEQDYIQLRTKVNTRIRKFCSQQPSEIVRCLDLEREMPVFSTACGDGRNAANWDKDGLHMTHQGYDRFGELVFESIKQFCCL